VALDTACRTASPQQGLSPQLAACYGSIAQMDEAIGRLLAGLREGRRQTLVLGARKPELRVQANVIAAMIALRQRPWRPTLYP
jgi:hypothetical protein